MDKLLLFIAVQFIGWLLMRAIVNFLSKFFSGQVWFSAGCWRIKLKNYNIIKIKCKSLYNCKRFQTVESTVDYSCPNLPWLRVFFIFGTCTLRSETILMNFIFFFLYTSCWINYIILYKTNLIILNFIFDGLANFN